MKTALFFISVFTAVHASGDGVIPERFDKSRYQETASKSPFALKTEVVPPQPRSKTEVDDIVLTGLGELDDGRTWVSLRKAGSEMSMTLIGSEPNAKGIAVKQVNHAPKWQDTTVVLRHGNDEATIKFSENAPPPNPPVNMNRRPPESGPARATGSTRQRGTGIENKVNSRPDPRVLPK